MTRVLVIGGGILGATTAWELAKSGAEVMLIDADDSSAQASVGSLAWLNVCSTADMQYAALRRASMMAWHEIKVDFPNVPVTFQGALMWGDDGGAVAAQVAKLTDLGWPCEVLDAQDVAARVPELKNPQAALFAPAEGAADPTKITDWMRGQARAAGCDFCQGTVRDISTGCVTLKDGRSLGADRIVVTAGHQTAHLLSGLGVEAPLRKSPGILMKTEPVARVIPYVMASPVLDFWQGTDGAVFMSSSLSKTEARADDLLADDALAVLVGLFPSLKGVKVATTVRRDRPIPADGFPIVGRTGVDGVWLAVTHSGMTLAPVIAQSLADDVLGRLARHDLGAFELGRNMADRHERAAL